MESTANTQEETGTDGATEGNELDVTRLETARDITVLFGSLNIAVYIGSFVEFGASSCLARNVRLLLHRSRFISYLNLVID